MKDLGIVRHISAVAVALAALAVLIPAGGAGAQTTTAAASLTLITWRVAGGSAPSGYVGKVPPVLNAPIVASVSILSGGKFVPLDKQTIYWYLDNNFIGGGVGAQNMVLSAPGVDEVITLRVEVPDYNNGNGAEETVYIPMVNPQVVIVAPYPSNMFSGSTIALQAVPYFFNATDLSKLSFNWVVNGQATTAQENPQSITINLASNAPPGYALSVGMGVRESSDPSLAVGDSVTLTQQANP